MLEISDPEVWRDSLTLDEVRLYMLFLNHKGHKDWRLPTGIERMSHKEFSPSTGYWYLVDLNSYDTEFYSARYAVIPVRDC